MEQHVGQKINLLGGSKAQTDAGLDIVKVQLPAGKQPKTDSQSYKGLAQVISMCLNGQERVQNMKINVQEYFSSILTELEVL